MTPAHALPPLIQGGMGVGVSDWRLANAVSRLGQLGVVSGTVIDTVLVRRLQRGDPGEHVRRAMARFPVSEVVDRVLARYFVDGGIDAASPYRMLPMWRRRVSRFSEQVAMLAAFVEVTLAREGHDGRVGINLLTKVQMPNLATLYGAMLAGVDVVLMGAGIPREIPGVLDGLARHEAVEMRLDVEGLASGATEHLRLDPRAGQAAGGDLARPLFLAIVSAHSLAANLARKANGRVDGFVIEAPSAGGHNAPPRGELRLDERGEPTYGERDAVDLAKVRELGVPFWLAGGTGSARALRDARDRGAHGVQVGTLFAFCDESGLDPVLKRRVLDALGRGEVSVFTDPLASPTGYPFKVVRLRDDPDDERRATRERTCDLGYLRVPYVASNGTIGYRCAAEPVDQYVAKGGNAADTTGRRCLCNALLANLGLGQRRDGGVVEPPLLTSGSDLEDLRLLLDGRTAYSAREVVARVLGGPVVPPLVA